MAMDEVSQQRKSAEFKWHQAQQEAHKGHVDKAADLARIALEEDPGFHDVRLWLARLYLDHGEARKASAQLEEIIHADRENQEAWALMRKADPGTATRLERVQSIAPDPFVAKRTAPLTDDLADDDYLDDDYVDEPPSAGIGRDPFVHTDFTDDIIDEEPDDEQPAPVDQPPAGTIGKDPFIKGGPTTDAIVSDDEVEKRPTAATPTATVAPATQPRKAPEPRGGHPWEFEQDRQFLAKWEAEPMVARMTAMVHELWTDMDAWDSVLALCAHSDRRLHATLFEAATLAATRLGVKPPDLYTVPERCMHPVIIKDNDPILAVPTGVIRAMTEEEMLFQIGREIGHIHTGYLAQMQIVKIICNRKARLVGDLASTLRDFISDHLKGWELDVKRDELDRLKKLGHAWQQRAELSADRAGLVCCRDIDVACAALAKTTAKSIDDAAKLTAEAFLAEFEGRDVGELAAIPVPESPSRNPQYAAYRIHMLRWWATTPTFQKLMSAE